MYNDLLNRALSALSHKSLKGEIEIATPEKTRLAMTVMIIIYETHHLVRAPLTWRGLVSLRFSAVCREVLDVKLERSSRAVMQTKEYAR